MFEEVTYGKYAAFFEDPADYARDRRFAGTGISDELHMDARSLAARLYGEFDLRDYLVYATFEPVAADEFFECVGTELGILEPFEYWRGGATVYYFLAVSVYRRRFFPAQILRVENLLAVQQFHDNFAHGIESVELAVRMLVFYTREERGPRRLIERVAVMLERTLRVLLHFRTAVRRHDYPTNKQHVRKRRENFVLHVLIHIRDTENGDKRLLFGKRDEEILEVPTVGGVEPFAQVDHQKLFRIRVIVHPQRAHDILVRLVAFFDRTERRLDHRTLRHLQYVACRDQLAEQREIVLQPATLVYYKQITARSKRVDRAALAQYGRDLGELVTKLLEFARTGQSVYFRKHFFRRTFFIASRFLCGTRGFGVARLAVVIALRRTVGKTVKSAHQIGVLRRRLFAVGLFFVRVVAAAFRRRDLRLFGLHVVFDERALHAEYAVVDGFVIQFAEHVEQFFFELVGLHIRRNGKLDPRHRRMFKLVSGGKSVDGTDYIVRIQRFVGAVFKHPIPIESNDHRKFHDITDSENILTINRKTQAHAIV